MEWTGTFEIPNSGVRVGGRVRIDAGESVLTTFGALAQRSGGPVTDIVADDDGQTLPMVWCVTEDGERLTLLNLVSLGGSLGTLGTDLTTTRQQWIVGSAVGALIEPVELVTFSSIAFGLTDLSAWLQTPRPSQDVRGNNPQVDLSVKAPDIAEMTYEGLIIKFGGQLGMRSGFDTVTVEYPARVTGTPPEEMTWEDLVNTVVTPIEAMLWIATGRFSALEEPNVRLEGDPPRYYRLWISPLQPRRFTKPEHRIPHHDMLYTAADIPGGVETGVTKWLGIWDDISPAFGPVIARYRAPFTYANDRFHAAVAALESYSDRRKKPPTLTKAERKGRRKRVEQAIQSQEPDLTEWVMKAVREAERPNLRTRLDHLLSEAEDVGQALTGEDRDYFLSAVVKARHAYAHSIRIVGAIEGGPALHWAAQGLNWVLRYHALTEIGFDPAQARERVLTDTTFVQETDRLRQALERPESA